MTGKRGDNQYTEVVNNVNNHQRTVGNTSTYALRRLMKDAPEQFQAVIDGQMSANAAILHTSAALNTVVNLALSSRMLIGRASQLAAVRCSTATCEARESGRKSSHNRLPNHEEETCTEHNL
jgi:hypothetical protein